MPLRPSTSEKPPDPAGALCWMVLLITSAGWILDVFEAQIFNITRDSLLGDLLRVAPDSGAIKFWGDTLIGFYLLGGAIGGVFFGALADRVGRRPTLTITILVYSVFSGLTYFVQSPWQVAALRFLVALGTGGEWAVGATMVAEAFPGRLRANASVIFHSTSNIGTWLAALVGLWVGAQWRFAYVLGLLPALLVVAVRTRMPESERWRQSRAGTPKLAHGKLWILFSTPVWRRQAILGMLLAATGLVTYWSITVAGQDLTREFLLRHGADPASASAQGKFAYGFVINGGGLVGSLAFGPLAQFLGRRRAFMFTMAGACLIVPITAFAPQTYTQLLLLLPWFGFFTFGFHSGYALYFPELFPTALRGTGTGFCFNAARLAAAPLLLFAGWLKSQPHMDLRLAICALAVMYLFGVAIVALLPETRNHELAA